MKLFLALFFMFFAFCGVSVPQEMPSEIKVDWDGKPIQLKTADLKSIDADLVVKTLRNMAHFYEMKTWEEQKIHRQNMDSLKLHVIKIVEESSYRSRFLPDAEFYTSFPDKDEVLREGSLPSSFDQKWTQGSHAGSVLLKKDLIKALEDGIIEVEVLNKNKGDAGGCGEQEGYLFYVNPVNKEIVYLQKFAKTYCE